MRQSIKCSVKTCKFQEGQKCTLDEIKVGNAVDEVLEKDETACKSFERSEKSKK